MNTTTDAENGTPHLPLAGIVVLDLTLARAGPTCVRHLADWGADVIRIEPPVSPGEDYTGSRESPDFQNLHRNKRTLSLNLKAPEGRAAFMRLVERADVVIENMRSAVKHKLGVAWEDVRKVNPRIVYGSISGFGQDGPYGRRAGVDQIVQGMGGLMSVTGAPGDGPMRVGIPIADLTAGNLLAFGVMMALYERTRTGVGRWVQTSLLEAQVFMMDFQGARWLLKGEVAQQAGNDHPTMIPTGVFPTSDGHMNIAAASDRLFGRLCDALGKPEWKQRAGWEASAGRSRNRAEINAAISEVTRTKSSAHWTALFEEVGVPAGPINSMDQVFADPQVQHLGIAAPVPNAKKAGMTLVASPLNLVGVPKGIRSPTPEAGEHTDTILRSIGYDDETIAGLRAKGVV